MENIHLWKVKGTARKSGKDFNNNQWTEFEVDSLAEQLPGKCCICGTELEKGWLCLDGGDEVCTEHVEAHEGSVPEYEPFNYPFEHLTSWGSQLDGGGLDSWDNFGPRHERDWYYQRSIVYSYAPDQGIPLYKSNYESILRDLMENDSDNVEDTTLGHWTYSYFRILVVKLYDSEGRPTPAAIHADDILGELEQYGIWDDEDLSEREVKSAVSYIENCGVSEDLSVDVLRAVWDLGGDTRDIDGSTYISDEDMEAAIEAVLKDNAVDIDSFIETAEKLGINTESDGFVELAESMGLSLQGVPSVYFSAEHWDAKLMAWASGERIGERAGDVPWPPTIAE